MSNHLPSDRPDPTPPSGGQRGCAPILLGLFGVVLLLPGVCAGLVTLSMGPSGLSTNDLALLLPIFLVCAATFAVGIWLIRQAFR